MKPIKANPLCNSEKISVEKRNNFVHCVADTEMKPAYSDRANINKTQYVKQRKENDSRMSGTKRQCTIAKKKLRLISLFH